MNSNILEKEEKITDNCNYKTSKKVKKTYYNGFEFNLNYVYIMIILEKYYKDIYNYKSEIMELSEQNKLLKEKYKDLIKANYQLKQESERDFLTNLLNRRGLMKKIQSFKINNRKFAVILLDIDKFRIFNNNYGHDCGDFVLIKVGKIIQKIVNKTGYIARWGGKEFIIILCDSDAEQGKTLAEKIRKEISNKVYNYQNLDLSITITLGVSVFDKKKDINDCIKRVKSSVHLGKCNGGNCVVLSNSI